MSTSYLVEIELRQKGDLNAQLATTHGALSKLGSSVTGLGGKLSDAFTGAVEKVGEFALSMGKIGAVAGIAAVTYGVVGLNQQLETTQIGLATVFRMQGFSSNFQDGLGLAADTLGKLKQDVKSLPGDLGQLAGIFTTIAPAASIAGASIDHMRALAGQTMALGSIFQMDSTQASREMSMLLSGRAGAHNILGMKLGLSGDAAKQFNAMSAQQRLTKIDTLMGPAQESIKAFGGSFTGLFTTLKDNIKYTFLSTATSPLFEGVKGSLSEINGWFDRNSLQVSTFAEALGSKLAAAWEWGSRKVKEWGPLVVEFVEVAYGRMVSMWEKISPYVEKFGAVVKGALSDPNGTIDKLTTVLELYAAAKVGGALLGGVGGVGGAVGLAKSAGSGIASGASAIGGWLEAMGPAVAVELAASLAAVAAAAGGLYLAFDQGSKLTAEWSAKQNADGLARVDAGMRALDTMTAVDYANQAYQAQMQRLIETGDEYHANMLMGVAAFRDAREMVAGSGHAAYDAASDQFALDRLTASVTAGVGKGMDQAKPKTGAGGGGGGMNIAKVEITVASNQDPNRIALAVMSKFQNVRRHPTSSVDAPNYSASNR